MREEEGREGRVARVERDWVRPRGEGVGKEREHGGATLPNTLLK